MHLLVSGGGLSLGGGSTGDNLDKLGGNLGLTTTVVLEGDGGEHLSGVLGRGRHGVHTGRNLGRGRLSGEVKETHGVAELPEVLVSLLTTLELELGGDVGVGEHHVNGVHGRHGGDRGLGVNELVVVVLDVAGGHGVDDVGDHRDLLERQALDLAGLGDALGEEVGELTLESGAALVANSDDVVGAGGGGAEARADLAEDLGVDTTAETTVRGHDDVDGLAGVGDLGGLSPGLGDAALELARGLDELGGGAELGRSNHLHGLGNLTSGANRLDTSLDCGGGRVERTGAAQKEE